jgi:hypothetical protein
MYKVQKQNNWLARRIYDLPEWETIQEFRTKEEAYQYKRDYLAFLKKHGATSHLPVLRVVRA